MTALLAFQQKVSVAALLALVDDGALSPRRGLRRGSYECCDGGREPDDP
jgi:hypothetical protein